MLKTYTRNPPSYADPDPVEIPNDKLPNISPKSTPQKCYLQAPNHRVNRP